MFIPSKRYRHNSSTILSDLQVCRLGEIEVLEGRIAPTPIVIGEARVRRAEIGRRDGDAPGETRFSGAAPELIARAAAQAVIKESRTERRRVSAVA
nr:hypothetical protein C4D60_Mb05t10270 [Ipomoea batatas]GME12695.1 hypothetical protein C4D60_Mb05t10270 [Ipomoea batatas]